MTEEHSVIKSAIRISAASILTGLAMLFLVASGPMRAGWGIIGSSANASNTVVAVMKTPSVQREVAHRLLIEIEKSVSPQNAQQIASQQSQLNSAVVALMNNPVVQQLVVQKVQTTYVSIQNQTPAVLDFSDLVNQATAVIHQIDPAIPAKIAGAKKFNVTFNPHSNALRNVGALGSGSVVLWFLGTLMLALAAFADPDWQIRGHWYRVLIARNPLTGSVRVSQEFCDGREASQSTSQCGCHLPV